MTWKLPSRIITFIKRFWSMHTVESASTDIWKLELKVTNSNFSGLPYYKQMNTSSCLHWNFSLIFWFAISCLLFYLSTSSYSMIMSLFFRPLDDFFGVLLMLELTWDFVSSSITWFWNICLTAFNLFFLPTIDVWDMRILVVVPPP